MANICGNLRNKIRLIKSWQTFAKICEKKKINWILANICGNLRIFAKSTKIKTLNWLNLGEYLQKFEIFFFDYLNPGKYLRVFAKKIPTKLYWLNLDEYLREFANCFFFLLIKSWRKFVKIWEILRKTKYGYWQKNDFKKVWTLVKKNY